MARTPREVAGLKPYLVLLSNESTRKVLAYTLSSRITFQDGRVGGLHRNMYRYPDAAGENAAMPRGREIFPGEKRVVALISWEIDPALKDFAFYARQFVQITKGQFPETTKSVEVALDAVIDDNGVLSGPDSGGLAGQFRDHLRAKRDLYRRLLESPVLEELLRSLDKETQAECSTPGPPQEAGMLALWRRLAVEDAQRLLSKLGEESLRQAMERMLRNEELVVHRELPGK